MGLNLKPTVKRVQRLRDAEKSGKLDDKTIRDILEDKDLQPVKPPEPPKSEPPKPEPTQTAPPFPVASMVMPSTPTPPAQTANTDGQLQPLRFRFEDSEHQLHTVHITEIIDSRFVEYVGIETFVFLCKALLEGAEKLYELRYTVRTHRWTLFREVY